MFFMVFFWSEIKITFNYNFGKVSNEILKMWRNEMKISLQVIFGISWKIIVLPVKLMDHGLKTNIIMFFWNIFDWRIISNIIFNLILWTFYVRRCFWEQSWCLLKTLMRIPMVKVRFDQFLALNIFWWSP